MKNNQKGVAIIEFALVLPLLLLLIFTTTEFGRAVYQYNTLTKSVRDAARYLSMRPPGQNIDEARNLVVYGNTAGTGSPLAVGLTTAHVPNPTWTETTSFPSMNLVTVTITGYTFESLMPSAFGINFGSIPFSPISATMRSPS